jgi:hypothetical protein
VHALMRHPSSGFHLLRTLHLWGPAWLGAFLLPISGHPDAAYVPQVLKQTHAPVDLVTLTGVWPE